VIAEVFTPLEFISGLLMKAKCAL